METAPDCVDPGTDMGIFARLEALEHQKSTVADRFCGVNTPYPNDRGFDIPFVSSFNMGKPLIASSTGPEIQLLLVDARRPPSLLGENSASPGKGNDSSYATTPFPSDFLWAYLGNRRTSDFRSRLDWTQSRRKEQQLMIMGLTETNAGTPKVSQRPQSAIAVVASYILIMCL